MRAAEISAKQALQRLCGMAARQPESDVRLNRRIVAAALQGLDPLLAEVDRLVPLLSIVNVSTAIHRIARACAVDPQARARVRSSELMRRLVAQCSSKLDVELARQRSAPKTQAFSNIAWALATMHIAELRVLQRLVGLSEICSNVFKDKELASVLWSLARLGRGNEEVRQLSLPVFARAAHRLPGLGFRCLVMACWSCATVEYHDPQLFQQMGDRLTPLLDLHATEQDLERLAFVFSGRGLHYHVLLAEIARLGGGGLVVWPTGQRPDLAPPFWLGEQRQPTAVSGHAGPAEAPVAEQWPQDDREDCALSGQAAAASAQQWPQDDRDDSAWSGHADGSSPAWALGSRMAASAEQWQQDDRDDSVWSVNAGGSSPAWAVRGCMADQGERLQQGEQHRTQRREGQRRSCGGARQQVMRGHGSRDGEGPHWEHSDFEEEVAHFAGDHVSGDPSLHPGDCSADESGPISVLILGEI